MTHYLGFALLLGLVAGVCSGLFGIGGGVIIVPALVIFLTFTHHQAVGTSLLALLMPVGALGVWQYYKDGKLTPLEIKMGLLIGLGIFFGSFLGAKLGLYLPEKILKRSFAFVLVLLAVKLWVGVKNS